MTQCSCSVSVLFCVGEVDLWSRHTNVVGLTHRHRIIGVLGEHATQSNPLGCCTVPMCRVLMSHHWTSLWLSCLQLSSALVLHPGSTRFQCGNYQGCLCVEPVRISTNIHCCLNMNQAKRSTDKNEKKQTKVEITCA
jgi:hypothetical protein